MWVKYCGAQNTKVKLMLWDLVACFMQLSFKFLSSAASTGHLILAPKG